MTEIIIVLGAVYTLCAFTAFIVRSMLRFNFSIIPAATFLFIGYLSSTSLSVLRGSVGEKTIAISQSINMGYDVFLKLATAICFLGVIVLIFMFSASRTRLSKEVDAVAKKAGIPEGAVSVSLVFQKYAHFAAIVFSAWTLSGLLVMLLNQKG